MIETPEMNPLELRKASDFSNNQPLSIKNTML